MSTTGRSRRARSTWETQIDAWAGKFGETKVVKWWTHRDRQMAFATDQFFTDMRSGRLPHDGSEVIRRHLANARKRVTSVKSDVTGERMWVLDKDGPNSPRKIDAGVASVLARKAYSDGIAEGAVVAHRPASAPAPKDPGRSVYRSRERLKL